MIKRHFQFLLNGRIKVNLSVRTLRLAGGKLFLFGECLLSLRRFGSLRRGEPLLTDGGRGGRASGCRPEGRWIKTTISMVTQTLCCCRHKVELYI